MIKTKNKLPYWGLQTLIDLHDCKIEIISNPDFIDKYIFTICDLIEVRRYKPPIIAHFGIYPRIAGFSFAQLIEESSLTGHFIEETRDAYIDIFSCKPYNAENVFIYTSQYFGAKEKFFKEVTRGIKKLK